MVKRPTWILLLVLAVVIGAYFLIKTHPLQKAAPTPTAASNDFLITQSDGILQSLRITASTGANIQMQRDPTKNWVITAPSTGVADQSKAGEAETQVGALKIVTSLQAPPELSSVGLQTPAYTMLLGFVSGASHKLEVGNLTPTSSGYYVRLDGKNMYVVSQSGIDALLNLLKAPPYPATETSLPTTPTPEVATPTP